jgi:hypothetical protein
MYPMTKAICIILPARLIGASIVIPSFMAANAESTEIEVEMLNDTVKLGRD